MQKAEAIYTVGHSNQSLDSFVDLLHQVSIDVIVDTRSYPVSKYNLHFCMDALKPALTNRGFKYLFLGDALGGKPKGSHFYNEEGKVLFEVIKESNLFRNGISRIITGFEKGFRIALLCGEENPSGCHRRLLLANTLENNHAIPVLHIRAGARLDSEADLQFAAKPDVEQLSIFS